MDETKCPECNGPMVSRKSAFGTFWGCKKYPRCKGKRNADGEAPRSTAAMTGGVDVGVDDDMPSAVARRNDRGRWRSE